MILFTPTPAPTPTPRSNPQQRPVYQPGELVDYTAQPGDTLPALAAHFNTTIDQIRAANTLLPANVTTLPPGLALKIPIYYLPFWGSSYQILPDSLYVDGPAQVGFDAVAFVAGQHGWLKNYQEYAYDGERSGAEIINEIALNYSISPRLLLALLDYQVGALSANQQPDGSQDYPLGYQDSGHKGLYLQLNWAANLLNSAYYQYLSGDLNSFDHLDGRIERPDPWQNAASVALQYYFSRQWDGDAYLTATGSDGLAKTYHRLFGDTAATPPHIPGSLQQPALRLPFTGSITWAFTGGPHNGWGESSDAPLAALDFAPPVSGCASTNEWATAAADGVIARTETGLALLALDPSGDEKVGWSILYLHLATQDMIKAGTRVKAGDPLGHPSCEGGHATGAHIHIARKYNGEWMPAGGVIPFDLDGWIAADGGQAYLGTLTRGAQVVRACTCSDPASFITAGK